MSAYILFLIILSLSSTVLSKTYICHNIGNMGVMWDSSCSTSQNTLGCNAGGLGPNCRFCGFAPFNWPCGPVLTTPNLTQA